MEQPKRLTRSADRMIFGVAGGIAEYLNVDPVLIRIAFVLLTLFVGGGLIVYLIMLLLMPEA